MLIPASNPILGAFGITIVMLSIVRVSMSSCMVVVGTIILLHLFDNPSPIVA